MKRNSKAIAGCCSTPCSLLFILTGVTVLLLAVASVMNSYSIHQLDRQTEELRAKQTKLQGLLQQLQRRSTKTLGSQSNGSSQSQPIGHGSLDASVLAALSQLDPSHQGERNTPCDPARPPSIGAESPKALGVTCLCMRHSTIGLPASYRHSCVDLPFGWAIKFNQVGREQSERKSRANADSVEYRYTKRVFFLGQNPNVNPEHLTLGLMRE